jgi:cell division septation protein DedD
MRNIFLALVLANLAFAAWHTWFADSPRPVRTDDADLPTITLVKELPADIAGSGRTAGAAAPAVAAPNAPAPRAGDSDSPSAAPSTNVEEQLALTARSAAGAAAGDQTAPAASAPDGGESATRCSSVGPFRELAQAATAAANLRAAGYEPTQRVAEGDIWIGYWIYIEAVATEEQANEILEKVRANGIADSYVISNSDSGNLVSLGVFSEISGVRKQREKVRELGYDPKVVDRTRRATVYWVDVVLAADQVLDFDALQTPGRIIRLEQRACERPPA